MSDLFDAVAAREAGNYGMAQSTRRNSAWLKTYLNHVRSLPIDWVGTGEDIRASAPIGQPDNANAWGAAMKNAVRLGLLVKTGRHVQMKAKKSHARETPEYRKAPAK